MAENASGKHLTAADDILLLKEANAREPWRASRIMSEWDRIAARLRQNATFPQDKHGKALSTRFNLLVKKHRDQALNSMRKSAREEDHLEREQLLDEIARKMRDYEAAKAEEKLYNGTKRDASGALALRAPLGEREDAHSESAESETSDTEEGAARKKQLLETHFQKVEEDRPMDENQLSGERRANLANEERKLDLLERQLDQQQQHLNQQHVLLHRQLDQQQQHLNQQHDLLQRQLQLQEEQMKMHQQQTQAFIGLINKLMEK